MTDKELNNSKRLIKGVIYDSLRNSLVAVDKKKKKSWAEIFIQEVLNEARGNPNGPLGQWIARQIMQDDILSKLDSETEKLLSRDLEFLHYRLIKQLYSNQREIAYDIYESRKVIATSRRSGKTNLAARLLVDYCIEPDTPCLYIHTKAENALTQCWPIVIEAANNIELPIERSDKGSLRIDFANGSSIKMTGNKDKSIAPTLRGGKYKLIIIDEAQDQRNMVELVEDVCEPMLIDYKNSCLILQGTPPRRPHTYFEKAYLSGKWKSYHFTMLDNPFLGKKEEIEEYIRGVAERKSISLESSLIKREYRGEFVYDKEAQVFHDYKTYKIGQEPKLHVDRVYIGNDYGWAAYNAIIGVAIDLKQAKGYVFYEDKFNKATVTDIVNSNKKAIELGRKLLIASNSDPNAIAIYGDTSDESIIYEMVQTHHLPAFKCYKYDRDEAIAELAENCRLGKLLVPEGGVLADEFDQTLYDRDEEDNITSEISDVYHPDGIPAFLYASRQWSFDLSSNPNYRRTAKEIVEGV